MYGDDADMFSSNFFELIFLSTVKAYFQSYISSNSIPVTPSSSSKICDIN